MLMTTATKRTTNSQKKSNGNAEPQAFELPVEREGGGGRDGQAEQVVGGEVDVAAEGLLADAAKEAVGHGRHSVEDLQHRTQRHDLCHDGDHLLVLRE